MKREEGIINIAMKYKAQAHLKIGKDNTVCLLIKLYNFEL